jgi:Tfp pilus assembly protein PilN
MSELNLLPYDMRRGKQGPLNTNQIIAVGIAAVLVIGSAIAVPIVRVISLEKKEARLQEYVKRNSGILDENAKLQKQIDDINTYVAAVDSIRDARILSEGTIRNIEQYIPQQVVLTSLNYLGGTIQIAATSSDYNAICAFSANLQTAKEFSGSVINSITKGTETGYTTNITISFGGGETVEGTQP